MFMLKPSLALPFALLACIGIAGCESKTDDQDRRIQDLESKLAAQKATMDELARQADGFAKKDEIARKQTELEKKIADIVSDNAKRDEIVRLAVSRLVELYGRAKVGDPATLETSSRSYQLLNTRDGTFLISVKDVAPYLDGYKLTLRIGNITSALFHGIKVTVKWGKQLNSEKDFDLVNELLPGCWNDVDVVLSPAKPEELETISVNLDIDTVSLTTPGAK